MRVRDADGPTQRIRDMGGQHMDHHHNQACQLCVTPSSLTSCGGRISDVRTVANGSAQHSTVMHSAKVVLGDIGERVSPYGLDDLHRSHQVIVADGKAHDRVDADLLVQHHGCIAISRIIGKSLDE